MFRPWICLAVVAGVVLLAAGCGDRVALDRLAPAGEGRAVRAISGDAFVLEDGRTVRLTGVIGPSQSGAYRAEATAALSDLVVGREVELLSGGAQADDFGRVLAHVRRKGDGQWVQGALLDRGAVRVRTWADNRAMIEPMLNLEARARRARKGLWALPGYRVLLPQEAVAVRGFAIVEGRAAAVRPGRFGQEIVLSDGGAGIVLRIPPRAAVDFNAAQKTPSALTGRLLRVRGSIWSDLSMRLDHPELLEVLEEP